LTSLQQLLNLPEDEREAKGILATPGEIAQQPESWKTTPLDGRTLLVCFASSGSRRQRYQADVLREVGGKGIVAERLEVGPVDAEALAACSERYLAVRGGIPDEYRPPVDVIVGQLLGLYFSLARG
jgi:hypothetical protein